MSAFSCLLAGGTIALIAHGGKTAVRAAVTASPEPFSNITLSLGEDVLAVLLTWIAAWQPWVAISVVAALVLMTVLLVRWVLRALASLFRKAEEVLSG